MPSVARRKHARLREGRCGSVPRHRNRGRRSRAGPIEDAPIRGTTADRLGPTRSDAPGKAPQRDREREALEGEERRGRAPLPPRAKLGLPKTPRLRISRPPQTKEGPASLGERISRRFLFPSGIPGLPTKGVKDLPHRWVSKRILREKAVE